MNLTGDKTLVTNMGQANLPLEISRRLAWAAMAAIFVVGIVLSLKQILAFKIASEDASSYYLSLGRAIFNGDWGHGQLPMIPPLYPLVLGVLAKCFFWAEQPLIVAGQVLNLVCFLASMAGVFWIGKILFSCRVGIAATAFVSVNQWLLKYTASIGPEMLYTFLLTMIAMLLAMYYCRPTAAKAGLIGAAAAMAMLTRSEGMVIFGCAFVVVVTIWIFGFKGKLIQGMLYVLVMLVVGAVILVPRIISVHSMIGSYVHDLRMVPYLNEGYTLLDLRDYPPPGHEGRHVDPYDIGFASLPATAIPPAPPPGLSTKSLGPDISEGFLMLFGLPSIFLAAVWFIIRSPIPRNRSGQLVVGAILITQIAAIVAMMVASQGVAEFSRRYTLPVAPIFQLWAGLGMVAICERFRRAKNPRLAALGGAIKPQLIFLGAMMTVLAIISLAGSSLGTRHAELAEIGKVILKQYGPGKRILATTSQSQFYADGVFVSMRYVEATGRAVPVERISSLCRDRSIDFIVASSSEKWCEQLLKDIDAGRLPGDLVVADRKSGRGSQDERARLIDAKKLLQAVPWR